MHLLDARDRDIADGDLVHLNSSSAILLAGMTGRLW
jgi:hypothetical protein